ncbi:zinc-alpha-2-glycoprotein-like [Maylandia zebra]|uniref:zinc-alpha-2-glycoprotein-like n=1 Tax=Maylandia zebra TaxID=106582 RepID=UPI000647819B
MKNLIMLLLLFHIGSTVKHSLKIFFMLSSGVPNTPDYVAAGELGGILIAYYDSNMKTLEPRQDWIRESMEDDPRQWETLIKNCKHYKQLLTDEIRSFKQYSNQTGGVHIIQEIMGCEQDDETKQTVAFKLYGYNGEDFIRFDIETEKWITSNPLAKTTKQEWDRKTASNGVWKNFLTTVCPDMMKMYFNDAKSFLDRKVPPSVSLLQMTPSSPVTCHATGFYPNKIMMFWRKDGVEIHEHVKKGEIFHNHDGTFQLSVNMNVSSVPGEDWTSYSCVFQFSGVEDNIVTKLNKSVIRTNWERPVMIPVTAAVVVPILLILVGGVGFVVYKRKKDKRCKRAPNSISELTEKLNPETK